MVLVGTEVIERVTVLNLTLVGSVIFNFLAFLTGGEEVSAGVFDAYLTLYIYIYIYIYIYTYIYTSVAIFDT